MRINLFLHGLAFASQVGCTSGPNIAEATEGTFSEINLVSLIENQHAYDPEVFHEALRILNSLETAPSCHRLAAKTLLSSCQTIDSAGDAEFHDSLDQIKSIFAARLAVCELHGAHAAIPIQCHPMIPISPSEDHSFKCYLPGRSCKTQQNSRDDTQLKFSDLSEQHIRQCLTALESRPQWWTSYSNARQNAIVICHAARSEAERERILHVHRAMTDASDGIARALSQATAQSGRIVQIQNEFSQRIKGFQNDLSEELRSGQKIWQKFIRQAEADLTSFVHKISKYIMDAGRGAKEVHLRINRTADTVDNLRDAIKDSVEAVYLQHQLFEKVQTSDHHAMHASALGLQSILADIKGKEIEPVQRSIQQLNEMMYLQTQMMQILFEKQGSVDEKIIELNKSLDHIHIQVSTAERSLHTHIQALETMLTNLSSNMGVNNDLAISLQTSLREARVNLSASLIGFIGIFGSIASLWLTLALLTILVAYIFSGFDAMWRTILAEINIFILNMLIQQFRKSPITQHINVSPGVIIASYAIMAAAFVSIMLYACRIRCFHGKLKTEKGNLFKKLSCTPKSHLSTIAVDAP